MTVSGIVLLLGEDREAKHQRIQAIHAALAPDPLDTHRLDAGNLSTPELLAFCRQQPAVSERRLITLLEGQKLGQEAVDWLVEHKRTIEANAVLLIVADKPLKASHPLSKAARKLKVERFKPEAAARPFALPEALGKRDVSGAYFALAEQRGQGKAVYEVLGLIAWQLQRWIKARTLLDQGQRPGALARAMDVKDWQARRLADEVQGRSLAEIRHLLERCFQLDTASKTGQGVPDWDLERFILEICRAG